MMATTGRKRRAPAEEEVKRVAEEDAAEEQVEVKRFYPSTVCNATNAANSDIVQGTVL